MINDVTNKNDKNICIFFNQILPSKLKISSQFLVDLKIICRFYRKKVGSW